MNHTDNNLNFIVRTAKARTRNTETDLELEEQIKSLQKSVAQERGEAHRFREEVRAYLQRGHL